MISSSPVVSSGCPGGCNASPAPMVTSSAPTYAAPVQNAPAPPAEAPKPAEAVEAK